MYILHIFSLTLEWIVLSLLMIGYSAVLVRFVFCMVLDIWILNLRWLSKVSPRYFVNWLHFVGIPLIMIGLVCWGCCQAKYLSFYQYWGIVSTYRTKEVVTPVDSAVCLPHVWYWYWCSESECGLRIGWGENEGVLVCYLYRQQRTVGINMNLKGRLPICPWFLKKWYLPLRNMTCVREII